MNDNASQIFQSGTPSRWKRFKWATRILVFLLLVFVTVVVVALRNLYAPGVPVEARAVKKFLTTPVPGYRESNIGKRYRGMRSFIQEKWIAGNGCGQHDHALNLSNSNFFSDSLGIRAGFYVAWDPQSYYSLERNISKLNLVIPEWFFLDEHADTLQVKIDRQALQLIREANVHIMPMLTNNINKLWRGDVVHRIINDPVKRERLIGDIVKYAKQYNFSGINIDFEELVETHNEVLTNFQKDLYKRLHENTLMLTQDVSPFNEDYDYTNLAKYNDYLFLMAYDEHHAESKPGPISSQRWIEAAVDLVAKDVPSEKIVLAMAAYGYDWSGSGVEPVTYQQALTTARESDGAVVFDDDTYNLSYDYYDGKDSLHYVHFTDAATNFNTLRFVTEYGLAGAALWRLGSEDSRVWDFYDKPMSKAALKNFDFADFSKVHGNNDVDYIGEGEVLDLLSSPTDGHITSDLDSTDMLISNERYDKLPSVYVVRKFGKATGKKLVLTYDDGPDPLYTRQILDTLAKYHVPATFFLVGLEAENNIPLVKRIFDEGHEIGNHTFTHPNMANVSEKRANLEMDLTKLLIECITGHSTVMFRAPFNADSEPGKTEELIPVALSRKRNYLTIGESIDPEDWEKGERPDFNADTIFNRTIRSYENRIRQYEDSASIILLHDAGGDRSETVQATGMIIRYFQAKGYTFTTVADLMHKKKEDLMPAVPRGSGYYLLQFNYVLAMIGYYGSHTFQSLFIFFLIVSLIRLSIIGYLAMKRKKHERNLVVIPPPTMPLVSIIVPAYNEQVNAVASLQNLLRCDYPNFNIIFVDDGSKDNTYNNVLDAFSNDPQVQIFTKPNGGKASALNHGISQTSADYVVCIDADTKLKPDAVRLLMNHFFTSNGSKIGAVAGNVKVGNEVNLITKWQSIEYITSQNFDRKAFAAINAITVVPGAIGAFRKKAIELAGGFTTDTLAEDCDLTMRILKADFIVTEEPKAIAMTEAPESIRQFMKQRFRWTFGVMQTFWKHKDSFFNSRHKGLGWIALPDMLLFKYFIPFFSPLADFLMLLGLLTGNAEKIGGYYLLFMLLDACIAALAFAFEKESRWKLVWLIPQRLVYRWLMLIVLFRSLRRAIKGELQHWGVLKRTGNVKEFEVPASSVV
jgi:cellulose synthase/poly-beta-1,6-N-acetylglucosamine synthase-like glycosyltransferase/spore germination protein YaaH/peptidoglycan/xylan/chitin deacetylase (PgdA/CDA1 family)